MRSPISVTRARGVSVPARYRLARLCRSRLIMTGMASGTVPRMAANLVGCRAYNIAYARDSFAAERVRRRALGDSSRLMKNVANDGGCKAPGVQRPRHI